MPETTPHIEPTRAAPDAPELAARVTGVALDAPLDPPTLTAIRAAWARHAVLVFPGQRLDAAALIAFSRPFGALEPSPADAAQRGGAQRGVPPEVWIISNIREAGRPIGALGDAEARWHTDMSYVEVPPRASILHAVEIPPTGGDTSFADMYAAYAALPPELRRVVDGAQVHHDATTTSVGERRAGAEAPGWRHPAVRITPTPAGPRSTSAAATTPDSSAAHPPRATRCSTGSGRTAPSRASSTPTGGRSATS